MSIGKQATLRCSNDSGTVQTTVTRIAETQAPSVNTWKSKLGHSAGFLVSISGTVHTVSKLHGRSRSGFSLHFTRVAAMSDVEQLRVKQTRG